MSEQESSHFIRDIIDADVKAGRYGGRVVTRFPPEPNGYLHVGHAKSIVLNFGVAKEFGGQTFLRMDDTNPTTEDEKYVRSIQEAVHWLGFDWGDRMRYASDYFDQMYVWAEQLIGQGDAYVCSLSEEQMRQTRGTVTEPGTESPYRTRSVVENLDLFRRMKAGEFEDGKHTLRAVIDMSHPNMKLRDPPLYRIRHAHHYRTGDKWCIYPLYDFAHCLSDAIEGITHSVCTLEFENNRPLYDWILQKVGIVDPPHQYEFARLNLTRTVMSKRKLNSLVKDGFVSGWDDPRLPTLLGMKRRGITPEALRRFCEEIGVAKANSLLELERLESVVRDDLEQRSPRAMAVLDPLRVVITNYPQDREETFDVPAWPEEAGRDDRRAVPFSQVVYVERSDFEKVPPKGWHRLAPGAEVRLRHAYLIRCDEVVEDADGRVVELRCSYDPESRGGQAPDGRRVRGTLHWVSGAHAVDAEVRLYDDLFTTDVPDDVEEGVDWRQTLNPDSIIVKQAKLEPSLSGATGNDRFQFERQGFFVVDEDSSPGKLVFNRTLALRDTFAKKKAAPVAAKASARAAAPVRDDRAERLSAEQAAAFARFTSLGLSKEDALVLASEAELGAFFNESLKAYDAPKSLVRWVANELARETKNKALSTLPITPGSVAQLARLVDEGQVAGTAAKEVFDTLVRQGGDAAQIVQAKGLSRLSDEALAALVDEVLAKHPDEAERCRAGAKNLFGFFMGQVVRASGGRADAQAVRAELARKLG